jgi:hypothetical protein
MANDGIAAILVGPAHDLSNEALAMGVAALAAQMAYRSRDLQTILAQEGEALTAYGEASATVTPTASSTTPTTMLSSLDNNTSIGNASLGGTGAGRMWWIENLVVGFMGLPVGTTVSFQIGGFGDADGKFPQFIIRGVFTAGGPPAVIPVRQMFRPSRTVKSALVTTIRNVLPAVSSNTTTWVDVTAVGVELTDDDNWNANYTLAVFGDSLNYGKGYGPTRSQDLYAFKLRDYCISHGYDTRIVSYSQPGRTSTMTEVSDRGAGLYNHLRANIGVYALATNDALIAAGGFAATWDANFRLFWAWWSEKYPDKPLLVITPGPVKLSADDANATTLTNQMISTIASINSPLCTLVNIRTAFDRTDPGGIYFRPGDNVHWTTAGHAAVWSVIQGVVSAASILPV